MTVVSQAVLIERGLAHNEFLLDINGTLLTSDLVKLDAPWNLPSRLFQFPIEVGEADADGSRRIGMMHPGLADHPFVQFVSEVIGEPLSPGGAPNPYGYTKQSTAQWWHAVDLVSSGHWRELIQTQQFTTPELIANAIVYGLDHRCDEGRGITTADARVMMAALGFAQPDAAAAHLASALEAPRHENTSTGKSWSVRCIHGTASPDRAWSRILGLELGWFAYERAGFICWTQKGRDRFAAGPGDTFTESATGQIAFAF